MLEIMSYKKIKDLSELKLLASDGDNPVECFIGLAGCFRSSKRISFNENGGDETWWIANEIDDTEDYYSNDEDFLTQTNIGRALENAALYLY